MNKKLVLVAILLYMLHASFDITAQKPSNMGAVFGRSGSFEVFVGVSGNKGGIYHTWQTSPGGTWNPVWTPYSPAPDDNPHGLVAGKDGDGRMIAAWITNGNIHMAQARHTDASLINSPEPTFRPANEADGHIYKYTYLTIANNPDGMIEIFALNERGRVYSIKEVKQDETKGFWTWKDTVLNGTKLKPGPILIGGGNLQNISVTKLNGRLALIGTGKDGKVYLKNQTVAGIWDNDPWINLRGNKIKEVYAQESKDNQLEIVALGSDKSLYLNFQNVGTTSFSGWRMLLNQQINGKFAPAIFFERFKDGSLFVVSHKDAVRTQFVGSFGKAFQNPNNGDWTGTFFPYTAVTIHPSGVNTADDLGFLSPKAFAIAVDDKEDIHYFSCYRVLPRVEHYIDFSGASSQRSLTYERGEHEIPDFPWQTNKQ